MSAPTTAVVADVISRDDGRCARCNRFVLNGVRGRDWSVHHRRPRGAGGSTLRWVNLTGNLILLCGSGVDGCHGWVESHRDEARKDGFLVALNGIREPSTVQIKHAVHGICLLDDFGGIVGQKVEF